MSELALLIRKLAGTENNENLRLGLGVVESVNAETQTCVITTITGSSTLEFECKLNASISDGILAIPDVKSEVLFLINKSNLPFIVQYSDLLNLSFLGSEFGGLVKVIELTNVINSLESKINTLISWGLTVSPPYVGQPLVPTQQSEIENTSVNHGG